MRKMFAAMLISLLFVMPVYGQADNTTHKNEMIIIETNVLPLIDQFEAVIANHPKPVYKYTTTSVNIRKAPALDAEILDTSLVNTRFEVVTEIDGWAMITTENGYAYMKADWFSDYPIDYSEKDLEILAHVLAGECQPYSDQEQRLVGSVVLNRVEHDKYPDTIEEVVFQKGQYSCTKDGNYYREPTERNWANAKWLLENGSILPEYVIFQSGGKQGKNVYLKTEHHYYCY